MPDDPLEFTSIKALQTRLGTISTSSGYHYTVEAIAVKLDPDHEVEQLVTDQGDALDKPPRPFFILELPPDSFGQYFGGGQVNIPIPFIVHAIHDTNPQDDDARLRTYKRLVADIEKAVASDDRRILARSMRELGTNEIWVQVAGEIALTRGYGAPNG